MKNIYIDRDADKNITGLFARPQYEGQEKLKETDKEIIAFRKKQNEPTEAQLNKQKIRAKMRQTAIDALKSEGELPADYKE